METVGAKVTILSVPTAAKVVADLRGGSGGGRAKPGSAVLVAGSGGRAEPPSAVLVAGPDAAAVGEAVAALRATGVVAAGWVGDPADTAVREMAAELFPGYEVVVAPEAR
jgi:hypothetical protein